jgi:hypothetical protein
MNGEKMAKEESARIRVLGATQYPTDDKTVQMDAGVAASTAKKELGFLVRDAQVKRNEVDGKKEYLITDFGKLNLPAAKKEEILTR